jgi:hypothetical protein
MTSIYISTDSHGSHTQKTNQPTKKSKQTKNREVLIKRRWSAGSQIIK